MTAAITAHWKAKKREKKKTERGGEKGAVKHQQMHCSYPALKIKTRKDDTEKKSNFSVFHLSIRLSIPPLFIPEGGGHRHVDEHRSGQSLSGALRDYIWHSLYCEVSHGLQSVHGHIEILCEGADVVHGHHLEEMPQDQLDGRRKLVRK